MKSHGNAFYLQECSTRERIVERNTSKDGHTQQAEGQPGSFRYYMLSFHMLQPRFAIFTHLYVALGNLRAHMRNGYLLGDILNINGLTLSSIDQSRLVERYTKI
jgi:hypothetical protein